MLKKQGHIFIIVAPSGTGKSTLISKLTKEVPVLQWSVSLTTRAPRPGEVDGVNYHFISKSEFEKKIKADEFVEWAMVHSNYYGTSKKFVQEGLTQGKLLLFDVDVQGADSMRKVFPSVSTTIFMAPPSIEELEKRLRGRGTEKESSILERLKNAEKELARQDDFDFKIVNDDIERAYQELVVTVKKRIKEFCD